MGRVVMIWLDAFSSKYLTPEKTPFICELSASRFHTNLEPLFAFAGIGATAFTGTGVNTHKIWCDYIRSESGHAPSFLKGLMRLCDIVPHDIMNQYGRYVICRALGYNPGTPNLIPVNLMDFFRVKEKKRLTENDPIKGVPTIFEQLRKHDARYFVTGLYESILEKQIIKRALGALAGDAGFILFRLGSPDRLGHKYGPESTEMNERLREIDTLVREMVTEGTRIDPSAHFIIFTDHGMSPVTEHCNLMQVLGKLPLKMPKDYLVFLNSTVANFWFMSDAARKMVAAELSKVPHGQILSETQLKELDIDNVGSEYGELLFALNEGAVFFPDFYRRRTPPKGMHGYAYTTYSKLPFIIHSPGITYKSPPVTGSKFVDVMPTILDLLDIPIPITCEGKSMLEGQTG